MKAEEFLKKKQQADYDNSLPDPNGNNLIFGKRQQCIIPTLLNAKREKLGYRQVDVYDEYRERKPRW